jgi:hypothetical protein
MNGRIAPTGRLGVKFVDPTTATSLLFVTVVDTAAAVVVVVVAADGR